MRLSGLTIEHTFAIMCGMVTTAVDAPPEALRALDALLAADPACAERDELAQLVTLVRRLRGFLDAYDVQIARRGQTLAERDRPQPVPATDAPPARPRPEHDRHEASLVGFLLSSGVQSGRDAKATGARAGACSELPGFEAALAAGVISGAHLDVLARHLRDLTDAERVEVRDRERELLNRARLEFAEGFDKTLRAIVTEIRARHRPTSDAEELERQRAASQIRSWVDRGSGMHKTLIEFDPLRQQEWTLAVEAHIARLKNDPAWARKPHQQLKVEAFLNAIQPQASSAAANTDGSSPAAAGPRVPKVIIVIDLETLLGGAHPATVAELSNGAPLPISTIREMLPDSDLVTVLLSGAGQPLYVGRTRRVATEAQRDALQAITNACYRNGCPNTIDHTRAHHTIPWEHGGTTDIDHLAPVCPTDHDAIHNGGHRLEIHDNHQSITWYRPDGTIEYHGPPPGRRRPPP
jgi:hypothetical protein